MARLAGWLQQALADHWVQAIYQPEPRRVVLHLYGRQGRQRLVIDLEPGCWCVALAPDGLGPNPPSPPPFCMLLRKHLEGTRLVGAQAQPGDRILYLSFRRGPAPAAEPDQGVPDAGSRPRARLVVELTGRFSNLLVELDGRLAGWLSPPAPSRQLAIGAPYRPPPGGPSVPPGLPQAAGRAAPEDASQAANPRQALRALHEVGRAWQLHAGHHRLEAARAELCRQLQEAEHRLLRRARHQQDDVARAGDPAAWRRMGELLLAYAGRVAPGAQQVRLPPESEREPGDPGVEIPLDPHRDAVANAEALFRRYRKAQRARQVQQQALERTQQALYSLQLALALARSATTSEELQTLREEAGEALSQAGLSGGPRLRPAPPIPQAPAARWRGIARFVSSDGLEVLAGRSAAANDRLTTALARPDDLWLHARQLPGAHVVIRCGGRPVPERTLEEAAALAARLCAAGAAGTAVEVDVAARRHVRKPPGAAAGFVLYGAERTLRVTPEAADRLRPWPGQDRPDGDGPDGLSGESGEPR